MITRAIYNRLSLNIKSSRSFSSSSSSSSSSSVFRSTFQQSSLCNRYNTVLFSNYQRNNNYNNIGNIYNYSTTKDNNETQQAAAVKEENKQQQQPTEKIENKEEKIQTDASETTKEEVESKIDTSTSTTSSPDNKQENEDNATEETTLDNKYIALIRNVPSLKDIQTIESEGDLNSEVLKNYKTESNDAAEIPRYLIHALIFSRGRSLPMQSLTPFAYMSIRPSFSVFLYSLMPWLYNKDFPKWINYDDFIVNSTVSVFKMFEMASNNDMSALESIASGSLGLNNLLYVRDLFYTHKRIAYQAKFNDCKIAFINTTIEKDIIRINVQYQIYCQLDVNIPKTNDITFPIRNPADAETVSKDCDYLISITWSSKLPESQNEDDLDWKMTIN
ncbi:hypothetical protein PPL_01282 [Heterostelium album PN500]|uniref:Uncharacterized protein n=1 Tax=Heterostelium pallidum (strain ATCC 26659 / Pp 5 / PN500) TaxID=670386 RepID=D3AYM0_HETP5|nr:hypothetical protein PPL_01282 [Heterostelium album PN500]EFA86047.1 hypothetical protein PPL_01282 [Heterostelium album PN500]|eukprot:XP_020438153.1 hypothetical protein PPL_01282 [Heterostelium album PN500]